jgi:hypothetical protein
MGGKELMKIADLEHLEVVDQKTNLKGGYAYAFANAGAYGNKISYAHTTARTYAIAGSISGQI